MLTPKQTKLLNSPQVQLLIQHFQAEPTPSIEFKIAKAIESRINEWTQTFEKANSLPVVARTLSNQGESTSLFKKIDPRACIEAEYTMKAWKSTVGKKIMAPF